MHLVPFSLSLVGPYYQAYLVSVQKPTSQLVPEIVGAPSRSIGLLKAIQLASLVINRVRPNQIAQDACLWYLPVPHHFIDVLHRIDLLGDAPMDAEKVVVDECRNGKVVEKVHHCIVDVLIVLDQT